MTNPTPIYRYPEDSTGKNPDNLVIDEEHQLSTRAVRAVAPTYGGFFAESVLVKDFATGMPLIRGVDYQFGELFEFPTGRYGKEIFGLILITKPNVTKVTINYQALGGGYDYSMDAVIEMLDSLNLGERPVQWGMITDRPPLFEPASHFHDIGDVYGFEYLVHAVELLRQAVLIGDAASHDEIYRYIDRLFADQNNGINVVRNELNQHIADKQNPHAVTKEQVGLGNVGNYSVATNAIALAGSSTTHYITPATLMYAINQSPNAAVNDHIANKQNPHAVTKEQVGLGNVGNYAVATNAIALDGTSTTHYITPAALMYAINQGPSTELSNHVANKQNPHSVTKVQVGLDKVNNYATATAQQTIVGTATDLYVTPSGLSEAITSWLASGNFDSRFIRKDAAVEAGITVSNGKAYIYIGGAWRQFYPAVWQA